ncbi:MAG: flippase [Ignavibacteriaceae bacterium]
MKEKTNKNNLLHTGAITKHTVYNLIGNILPIFFAIFLIPELIKNLGTERFGILGLAWMIIGYFSFFDFGIGRALTKVIAEKIGTEKVNEIPGIFWSSLFFLFIISFLMIVILISILLLSDFTYSLKISKSLEAESTKIFLLLIFSIPIVITMAGVRGVLEAYQKFATINIIKVILGVTTYLGPVIVLLFIDSLFWVIAFLIIARIVIWILFMYQCFKTNKNIQLNFVVDFKIIKPILKFSLWITIGNIIVPIIFYSDRFLIGTILSASALTFYVTPFELVSRISIIPNAIATVLFPIFSANQVIFNASILELFQRGLKAIVLILYPIILVIITFAYEGMEMWVGKEFADKSTFILQILSVGILMNSLSLIPNIFFQGNGKPRIPTLINLAEFPVYIFLMWFAIKEYGLNGAGFVFTLMATIDALLMYLFAKKTFKFTSTGTFSYLVSFIAVLIIPFFLSNIVYKIIFLVVIMMLFLLVTLKYILSKTEKDFIFSKLRFIK